MIDFTSWPAFIRAFKSIDFRGITAFMSKIAEVHNSIDKKKRWLFYLLLGPLFTIVFLGFTLIFKKPEKICTDAANAKLYQEGLSNNHYQYFTKHSEILDLEKQSVDFEHLRLQQLKSLLHSADSALLLRKNNFSYEQKIGSYFCENDELSVKIIHELKRNRYLYVHEVFDKNNCTYSAGISLAKAKASEIDSLVSLRRESKCVRNAINDLIMKPLDQNGEITLSFYGIFSKICSTCPKDPWIVSWLKGGTYRDKKIDSFYFQRGEYKLSAYSMDVLRDIAISLSKNTKQKYSVELHGYTDPSPILAKINYDEAGHYGDRPGVLLPGGVPLTGIETNLQLSYARAYSCYNYLNDLLDRSKIKLFYTGEGVFMNNSVSDPHQRAVNIYIRKEN